MIEERKEELRQLLSEAMQSVIIEGPEGYKPISVEEYRDCAKAFRKSYKPDLSFILDYQLNIQDDAVKSKLFNFMKEELADYIHEDESLCPPYTHWIQTAKNAMHGPKAIIRGTRGLIPLPLDRLLEKFLEIVIASGAEQAILVLDRCTRDTIGTFEKIIFLQGLLVRYSGTTREARETHIAEGIRLVQLPSSSEDLPPYLFHERLIPHLFHERSIPNLFHESFIPMADDTRFSIFSHALLLIIDYTVSPLFYKPFVKAVDESKQYEIKIESAEFPNFDVDKFCQALSLTANYAVESLLKWQYIGEDELFNVAVWSPKEIGNLVMPDYLSGIGVINETDIDKAKYLYELLTNLSSNIGGNLQIPIDRWIKSKTNKSDVDKMIDLGVAFEALYLPKNKTDQLAFQFRLRASWHLGKNKAERRELIDEFDAIYTLRSQAVHNGELSPTVKIRKGNQNKSGKSVPTSEFLPRAQELCRASIIKILEDGEYPDDDYWKDLILGEESL